MPTLRATNKNGPNILDGSYAATLVDVQEQEATARSVSADPWLLWTFIVHDGSKTGVELSGTSSVRGGPAAKARLWAEALLGRKMELDEALELDGLIPHDCQVTVKHNARGYPTVVDVLPALQTKPHATPKPVASPTPKPPEPDDIPF